ncbi:MAG: hypothetical protein FWD58_04840 [Firmicutes bacterium]|nr:hypothetical protein [Bacillota bacterium]
MKNFLKKALPTFIYVAAVTGIVSLLIWYGSAYNYAYEADLGGGSSLDALFPQPALSEPDRPQIVFRDPSEAPNSGGGSDSKQPGTSNPGDSGSTENPGSGEGSAENPGKADPPDDSGDTDPPENPGDTDSGNTDPPEAPDIPFPADLKHLAVYSRIEGGGEVIFAAVFDLEAKTACFFSTDLAGVQLVPPIFCTISAGYGNEFSARGEGMDDVRFTLWEDGLTLDVQSKALCAHLGYENLLYDGLLTLYAPPAE